MRWRRSRTLLRRTSRAREPRDRLGLRRRRLQALPGPAVASTMIELPIDLPAELVPLSWLARRLGGHRRHRLHGRRRIDHPRIRPARQLQPRRPAVPELQLATPGSSRPTRAASRRPLVGRDRATGGSAGRSATATPVRRCCRPSASARSRTADAVETLRNADGGFDIEVTLVHPDGVTELYLGQVKGPRIDLATDAVVRTAGRQGLRGRHPPVRPRRRATCSGRGTSPHSARTCARTPPADSRRSNDDDGAVSPFLAVPGAVRAPTDSTTASPPTTATRSSSSARSRTARRSSTSRTDGVLSVTGPDRLTWLDSLTTQALDRLAAGGVAETAHPRPAGTHRVRRHPSLDDGETTWLIVDRRRGRGPAAPGSTACASRCASRCADRTAEFATIGTHGRGCRALVRRIELAGARRTACRSSGRDPWPRCRRRRLAVRGRRADTRAPGDWASRLIVARETSPHSPTAAASRRPRRRRHPRARRAAHRRVAAAAGRPRSTSARSRTSSTGCARPCTSTRAATAGRRPSPRCTTSAIRRGAS